jgi:hypothetical protein
MNTYMLTCDDGIGTAMVRAGSEFPVIVFARARGYVSPRVVTDAPTDAPHIDAIRAVERERANTRAFWQMREY